MITHNHCTVDLNKAQWCELFYMNQYNDKLRKKPKNKTVHCEVVKDEMHFNGQETMLQFATRLGLFDRWTAYCKVTMTANKTLCYTGEKAISIMREWNRRIFNKGRQ